MGARLSILRAAIGEHLRYDLGPLGEPVARTIYAAASAMTRSASPARRARGYSLLMRLHTAAFAPSVDDRIIARLRDATARERQGIATGLWRSYDTSIEAAVADFVAAPNGNPGRYIGSRLLVIKAARPGERGVIAVDYSNVFPLVAGLFDLKAIAERYTLVLEPSWAGCCAPEILLFTRLSHPVFVQTIEPRDHHLLSSLGANLKVVPIAANWWVDTRSIPEANGRRDIDVIMVASWADMKRHWRVFKVLARLRRQGHRLKVVLVGYAYGRTREYIVSLARHFGIGDQVEAFEGLTQEQVSALLARSKIHILWSRRECANRAVIEAMMADVPSIVRTGLTFGFAYPYINPHTGCFVGEGDLEAAILDTIRRRDQYTPRKWILENMSCQKATAILEDHLHAQARAAGEPWSEGLVVKTSTLHTQRYFDPSDRERFAEDYRFLESVVRKGPAPVPAT